MMKYSFFIIIFFLSFLDANVDFKSSDNVIIKYLPSSTTLLQVNDKNQEIDGNYVNISYLKSAHFSDIDIGGEIIFGNDKVNSSNKYYYVGLLFNKYFEPFYINSLKPYFGGGVGFSHFEINSINGQKVVQETENRYGILLFSVEAGFHFDLLKDFSLKVGYKGLGNYLTVDNRKKVTLVDNSIYKVVYEGFTGPYIGLQYKF